MSDRSIYLADANGTLYLLTPVQWSDGAPLELLYRLSFPPETVAAPPPKA